MSNSIFRVQAEGDDFPTNVPHTSGRPQMIMSSLLKGEDVTDDRLYGGAAPSSYTVLTGGGVIKASAGKYYGFKVTTALSAAAITIYDNASAASGSVIDVIPASTGPSAANPTILASPIPCANGIYATFAGNGTVLFLYT